MLLIRSYHVSDSHIRLLTTQEMALGLCKPGG